MRENLIPIIVVILIALTAIIGCVADSRQSEPTNTPAPTATPEPPGFHKSVTVHGPVVYCAYYPEYDKSLLYTVVTPVRASAGMTGAFFEGNICTQRGE